MELVKEVETSACQRLVLGHTKVMLHGQLAQRNGQKVTLVVRGESGSRRELLSLLRRWIFGNCFHATHVSFFEGVLFFFLKLSTFFLS